MERLSAAADRKSFCQNARFIKGYGEIQYLAGHESSKITMDIYAKVKYNKPDELAGVLTDAFAQWDEAEYGTAQ